MVKLLVYKAEQQGKQVLFMCSDNRQLLTGNWFDAVTFLLEPCDFAVTWNVDRFAEAFISLIPSKYAKELKDTGQTYLETREKIYYQVGRVFAVTYGRETNFYGLSRYADKEIPDVKELEQLGYKVLDTYKEFGIEPSTLTSPIGAYSQIIDKIDYPRACDLSDSALPLLDACSKKAWEEWREVYKLGHWNTNEVTDVDLVSAYPSLIARLPDIRGAKFFEADVMPDDNEYSWGELHGKLKITKDVTPFLNIGEWEDSITTEHLWLINHHELGEFELKHGFFLKLPHYYKLPFKDTMLTLYNRRCSNNLMVQRIAKAVSVGIGGKFAQRYDNGDLGDNYNSIYSRMITSRCAIKVADFIHRNGIASDTISVMVDGVLFENHGVQFDLGDGGMGSWRKNLPSPFLVASKNYQWGNDKHPNGLYYPDMIELINKSPKSPVFGEIDLNLLTFDRIFEDRPKNGQDLLGKRYNSKPMVVYQFELNN